MKHIAVNYNHTPTWLLDKDYLIYDRSDSRDYLKDFDQSRIIYTPNIGNVDYDKLSYLVDNYNTLPDIFFWGKSNLFKYITEEEYKALPKNDFTPLLTQNHKTYSDKLGVVCFYAEGMYHERNDSWFLQEHSSKHFRNWNQWAAEFFIPAPSYIPFPPGGNFILTRERVHRYGKDTYDKMRHLMNYSQIPGEAQCAERSYYLLWR
jgi:hypothetical protein